MSYPKPQTLNPTNRDDPNVIKFRPKPQTLDPKPQTLNPTNRDDPNVIKFRPGEPNPFRGRRSMRGARGANRPMTEVVIVDEPEEKPVRYLTRSGFGVWGLGFGVWEEKRG